MPATASSTSLSVTDPYCCSNIFDGHIEQDLGLSTFQRTDEIVIIILHTDQIFSLSELFEQAASVTLIVVMALPCSFLLLYGKCYHSFTILS